MRAIPCALSKRSFVCYIIRFSVLFKISFHRRTPHVPFVDFLFDQLLVFVIAGIMVVPVLSDCQHCVCPQRNNCCSGLLVKVVIVAVFLLLLSCVITLQGYFWNSFRVS